MEFKHDCEYCEYLGSAGGKDIYNCTKHRTLVLRYGNEPHEYSSYPYFVLVGLLEA